MATTFDLLQQLGGSHGYRGVTAGPVGGAAAPRWARRAAAAARLLAGAAALALVVAGLLNSPRRLGLALIAFCVAVMAAWTALVTRRHSDRPASGRRPPCARRAGRHAGGADVIGMAGGDGSQALVADVARRHDLPIEAAVRDSDPARPTSGSGVTSSGVCGALGSKLVSPPATDRGQRSVTRDGGGSPG